MKMPFIDLKTQYRHIENDIKKRIIDVLEHGQYIMGPEVHELDAKLAEFAGVKHAISCSSGTDALLLALMAHGVGPGDAVFTTPFTFVATAEVIALTGATPIFVDIDPVTFNIDVDALRRAIMALKTGETAGCRLPRCAKDLTPRGIIPVDLFGIPADYDAIMDLAQKHGMFVLEDGAQSFGATYKGRRTGSLGHVAATSFFPAKPLGGYGDGGAVFTDDDQMASLMRSIMIHGMGENRYENVRVGINGRLDSIQAAVLLAKLPIFPGELAERQRVADRYTELLAGVPGLVTPTVPEHCTSAWAQYSLLAEDRNLIQKALREADIPSMIYYPLPLHQQKAFASLGYREGDMPVTEDSASRIFSLPMHPYLEDAQIVEICNVIRDAVS
ncbi:dTDP-4-amino-4,6-dideoxygalactose transaminase [Desulfobaculum xiamenense]|uniref:dTDP-4-amino-4,6-dideoxygalactose transaminase n=1 Tax=Desulfobaculum xiamenense TaxID=995050 RepID=A0A846QR54_9BACT|nr:DegT/DnrJ/EryC1/StrS family aminotransferase [Desulfobaculum xiamenense]NJB68962.1 dTDP-4-amino-4,6-dideoxygalactose transaminase [Desulfobaculum xiamenense]